MLLASRVTSVTIDAATGLTLNTSTLGSRVAHERRAPRDVTIASTRTLHQETSHVIPSRLERSECGAGRSQRHRATTSRTPRPPASRGRARSSPSCSPCRPQGVSRNAIGNGVRVSNVAQQFTQGNIDFTDNSLDLALSGQGFFVLSDGGATRVHARRRVPGRPQRLHRQQPASSACRCIRRQPTAASTPARCRDMRLVTSESAPSATTDASKSSSTCRANATPPTTAPFDPADRQQLQPRHVADDLRLARRRAHRDAVLHQDGGPERVDDAAVRRRQCGRYGADAAVLEHRCADRRRRTATITFPSYTPATGAAPMNLTFDFGRTTQYGGAFNVNAITQDGYTTGRLIGIDIDSTGVVQARFTNGRSTRARPGRDRELLESAGPAAARQHELGGDVRLGPGAARPGRQLGLRPDPVRRARSLERRHHRAARQHDHRAAQLPGERADDLDGGRR